MAGHLEIERRRSGKGFKYFFHGRKITAASELSRLTKLAIPPAWKDVRIACKPGALLQATGFDAKGRKQYRYHEKFRKIQDRRKFDHVADFARRLPKIRKTVRQHLKKKTFSRERVLAAVVDILQRTNMRIGNEVYTRSNGSYGLTTLRNSHAKVNGSHVQFYFRAKSGKMRKIAFDDKQLSQIVRRCQRLPGIELFCYQDREGKIHDVTSTDVNQYICEIAGGHFTAKDFRTWCGTLHAIELFKKTERANPLSKRGWRRRHLEIIRATAEHLGNTPSICEKYYIHPKIFEADIRAHDFSMSARRTRGLSLAECQALSLIIN
jgi:DNA topoisomerase-1